MAAQTSNKQSDHLQFPSPPVPKNSPFSENSSVNSNQCLIISLIHAIREREKIIAELWQSTSWSITRPFRILCRLFKAVKTKENKSYPQTLSHATTQLLQSFSETKKIEFSHDYEGFDPDFYLSAYPDISNQIDPLYHYHNWGWYEGKMPCNPYSQMLLLFSQLETSKDTIFIVSSDASQSDIPILILNIAHILRPRYNIIGLSLTGGAILDEFRKVFSIFLAPFPDAYDDRVCTAVLSKILPQLNIKFALVNSVKSRSVLPVLSQLFIPTLTLVHEFATHVFPHTAIREVLLWSSHLVFSTHFLFDENARYCKSLLKNRVTIIPPGKSEKPRTTKPIQGKLETTTHLRERFLPKESILIIGIGEVKYPNGVDLFISCAHQVLQLNISTPFHFIWIGNGFDPDSQLGYSTFLQDQLDRNGLNGHISFIKETENIEFFYSEVDLFFLASRQDPFPFAAMNAMHWGIPVFCFAEATGIAEILKQANLHDSCVLPYLDITAVANKLSIYIDNFELRKALGNLTRQAAISLLNMDAYVKSLEKTALTCIPLQEKERYEYSLLQKNIQLSTAFTAFPNQKTTEDSFHLRKFIRSWRTDVDKQKLFPGFHPGIFAECQSIDLTNENPLCAYISSGQPDGPWKIKIISPISENDQKILRLFRIAIHIHVFYSDIFLQIYNRLIQQQIPCDLLLSAPCLETIQKIVNITKDYTLGNVNIRIVPNRGRDIGPFFTEFRDVIAKNYDIVGHLHTKKSVHVKDSRVAHLWLNFLLENLLGGKYQMASMIINTFYRDRRLGLVFPDDPFAIGWDKNFIKGCLLAKELGLQETLPNYFNFPVGTMFWARPKALKHLFDRNFSWDDYPEEPIADDGTVLHAIERILPFSAESMHFTYAMTHVPEITR